MEKLEFGTIYLKDDVIISDPCYDFAGRLNTFLGGVKEGVYNCFVNVLDYGAWGKRVKEMIILHKDYDMPEIYEWEFSDTVMVDSGTMSIGDYEYFKATRNNDEWYNKAVCSWDSKAYNSDGKMFISTSGVGDGEYDVEYADNGKNIYAIRVIFLDE
jgi:hypothetical protein